MPLCGCGNAKFIKSLLEDKFFSEICKFSALQMRKSDDMCTLFQAMILLDNRYEGYEYDSLSADEVMRYAKHIKNNYSEKQKEHLYDIIDYLEKAFPVQEKMLKKINLPMIMLCADIAMGEDYNGVRNIYRVGPMYFRQWFYYFFTECYAEYSRYCSSGGTKKEKTLKRIEIMEKSFRKYFELEEGTTESEMLEDSETVTDTEESEGNAPDSEDGTVEAEDTETDAESDTESDAESGEEELIEEDTLSEAEDNSVEDAPPNAMEQPESEGQPPDEAVG